jgi:negative regulator of flagellin synthesis FlgM
MQVQKVSIPMTDGIYNNVRRPAVGGAVSSNAGTTKKSVASESSSPIDVAASSKKASAKGIDDVQLSNVDKLMAQEPAFDRAKVESIKQAIENGQYPLNARHIAESFYAIEQMISE